jgi:hypothetical protein
VEAFLVPLKRLVYALPFLLAACDDNGNPAGSNPTPRPTATTAVACQQETLLQGVAPIPARALLFTELTVKTAGRVDVSIDWTRADATMRVVIITGACNTDDFRANTCTKLLDVKAPPKPARGTVTLPADTYSVAFESQSSFQDQLSYTIVRSDASCPLP